MEIANGLQQYNAAEMAGTGDIEVDDMDLDLTIDPEMAALEEGAQGMVSSFRPRDSSNGTLIGRFYLQEAVQDSIAGGDGITSNNDAAQTADDDALQPAPMKVYIHGLDELTTEDVKSFTLEHFPTDDFEKVEWIDDSSANIVFNSVDAVALALEALVDQISPDSRPSPHGDTYKAKKSSNKPAAELRVRSAVLGDVKKPRAHEASRFYLMHPEQDPRERKKQYDSRRGRNGNERGDYKRRRFDDREQRRREENGAFDVNMYDDDAGEGSKAGGSISDSESYERRRRPRRSGGDLFGEPSKGRLNSRLRDRSASPPGDGDGRLGFEDDQPVRRTARQRSTTPPHLRHTLEREYGRSNTGKELFPNGHAEGTNGATKELFPMKSPRELFPNRSSVSVHRRTPAFDAADDTPQKPRSLADRITGGPNSSGQRDGSDDEGIGFRGAAAQSGFSIRGAASDAGTVVKELFPLKAGANAGKELFGEKIKGRGGARRRAEDMF